jgi:hypothetical protein
MVFSCQDSRNFFLVSATDHGFNDPIFIALLFFDA